MGAQSFFSKIKLLQPHEKAPTISTFIWVFILLNLTTEKHQHIEDF